MIRISVNSAVLAVVIGTGAGAAFAHDFRSPMSGASPKISAMLAAAEYEPPASKSRSRILSHIAYAYRWQAAGTLKVCFWDGSAYDDMKRSVMAVADELTAKLPVKFQWKTGNAFTTCPETSYKSFDVRVSLRPDSRRLAPDDDSSTFFAVIGKPGKGDDRKATVNLPFGLLPKPDFVRSRILHEFCHVLGCLHEHQRELCRQDFDKDEIISRLGITEDVYEAQYVAPDSSMAPTAHGVFDEDSIMLYRTEEWMFRVKPPTSKCYRQTDVTKLSSLDEAGLAEAYSPRGRLFSSMTFDQFLAYGADLQDKAQQLRASVELMKGNLEALSVEPKTLATDFTHSLGTLGLLLLEAQLAATEEEASGFDFKQETVDAFRAALALPG